MGEKLSNTLVTGASGYIGSQLIPKLIEKQFHVCAMVRDKTSIQKYPWADRVDITVGDALNPDLLADALEGIDTAYYLIHSMKDNKDFAEKDTLAAKNFSRVAVKANVKRIIYLGGLGGPDKNLSPHLRSRHEVGKILAGSEIPVIEFRASVVVGSGSISFEMVRYLTERLPIMICPRWLFTKVQPIAIDDVLAYLTEAMKLHTSHIIEIGGADVLTYGDMIKIYANVRGLKRLLIPVPVLTPHLSSYWIHWVTPISASYAHPLIEGLRCETIVHHPGAKELFPNIKPMDYVTAVKKALMVKKLNT